MLGAAPPADGEAHFSPHHPASGTSTPSFLQPFRRCSADLFNQLRFILRARHYLPLAKLASGNLSARSTPAFTHVSSHSASGSLSATIPAPTL
jgi:hypothetical protein